MYNCRHRDPIMIEAWTILYLTGALLMRAGLISYAFGTTRSRNAATSVARQLLDWTAAVLAFWAVGAAIASRHDNPYFGFSIDGLIGLGGNDVLVMGLAAVSIVGATFIGATAERSRLWPMLTLSLVTAAVTLPLSMYWMNHGWLHQLLGGYPGTAYVHLIGGTAALVAIKLIGPRDGKYHRDGSTSVISGHNMPGVLTGAFAAVVGGVLMIASGPSNEPVRVAINVILSAAASMFVAAVYCQWKFAKLDLPVLAASLIAGVVAASASPATMAGGFAVLAGGGAGLIVVLSLVWIDFRFHLDDVSGAVSIHGVVGAWAMVVGAASHAEPLARRARDVGFAAVGVVAVVVLTVVVTFATLKVVSAISPLRAKESDEFDGLDIADHDTAAYPDFQQNSIR